MVFDFDEGFKLCLPSVCALRSTTQIDQDVFKRQHSAFMHILHLHEDLHSG